MHIAIVDPLGSPYDGSTPSKRALGGSESAVVFIARELVKLGIDVDVFNHCTEMDAKGNRTIDGVQYWDIEGMALRSEAYSVVIVSRTCKPFITGDLPVGNKYVLWMHDTFCENDESLESLVVQGKIDEVWTLSDWHTTYISQCTHGHRRMMEVLKRKIWVTRNGANVYRDVNILKKSRNSFIFNAAVSKGMETLLEDIWPRVKERIPDAYLTIIGGAYPLKEADIQNDKLRELDKKHSNKNDVLFTGLMKQEFVANHLADASFMIYPQSLPETYGISTIESLAYGTPVISGRFGAMEETAIDDACYLMDYPIDSNILYTFNRENHISAFVELVVSAYNNQYLWQQKANAALKVRDICGWDKVALQWKQHIYKKLGEYLPIEEYKRVQEINHRTHEIFNRRWSNPEEWAYYPEKENFIEVIVPFYNASQWLSKCIESIASQNYERYRVHLINDASTDDSHEVAENATIKFGIRHNVVQYKNEENLGALANQIRIIKALGESIIVLIDGDDALVNDPNVFKKINRLYHKGAEFTYGSCWSVVDNIPLVAQEYPKDIIESKRFKDYQLPWRIPYTHLRTFKRSLFDRIDDLDLRDDNGNYFRASGDTALFYALIEQCSPDGIKAVRDILYLYNDAHPNNDYKINNIEQVKNQETIIKRNKVPKKINKNKRILIAIPTSQNIHPETFKSIYELKVPEGYQVTFQHFYGYCIDQVRNLIAHYTISNYFDYLFCVDYDIGFSSDALEKLLEDQADIVSGMYIQRKPNQHVLELYRNKDNGSQYNVPIEDLRGTHLHAINGCGMGCCLIKTEVLKEVGYPYFTYHHAIEMRDTVSEDVDFCNKAQSKGFNIYVDTRIKCRHYGQMVFEVMND